MDETGKMSKSKGATLTVSVLKEKGYHPLSFRFMCLNSHYRRQLVFSYENLENATQGYLKLKNKVQNLKEDGLLDELLFREYDQKFRECLENDLNTANAITLIYDLLKSNVNETTKLKLIKSWDQVLSLDLCLKESMSKDLDNYIKEKLKERNIAKEKKDYQLADQIRNELEEKGIHIKDTREGTTYEIR